MQELQSSWKSILNKYGSNALYVEGTDAQPVYRFSFDINYQGLTGNCSFSWENTQNDFLDSLVYPKLITGKLTPGRTKDDPRNVFYKYGGTTVIMLEISTQQNRLKIFDNGKMVGLLSRLHPNQVKTGYPDFDKAFITIAKPTSIVSGLMPYLQYLTNPLLGGSIALDTDWQDAVTTKFYLRLQVNTLLIEEKTLEELLEKSFRLIKQLEM